MRNDDVLTALSEGLDALVAGEDRARILARYESMRNELQPLLEAAAAARDYAQPLYVSAHAQRQNRSRFLTRRRPCARIDNVLPAWPASACGPGHWRTAR
jgi:hypothetical protein